MAGAPISGYESAARQAHSEASDAADLGGAHIEKRAGRHAVRSLNYPFEETGSGWVAWRESGEIHGNKKVGRSGEGPEG